MIKVIKNFFNGKIKLIKLKKFKDQRGYFMENYNYKTFKKIGINEIFCQDNESLSKRKGTIRGLHFQKPPFSQSKLIQVRQGEIFDVFIDIKKTSKTFGKYKSINLKSNDNLILYIHHSFAHGFCSLTNNTIVTYKTSKNYSPKNEKTIKYDDPIINIKWPKLNKDFIISNKDLKGINLNNIYK